MGFNAEKVKNDIVEWIKNWFEANGKGCNAVIGISGGKDSSIVAALCVEALGKDKVIGVLMPNGEQGDINDAVELCEYLDIPMMDINIEDIYKEIIKAVSESINYDFCWGNFKLSEQSITNLPPRIRMSVLYFVSQNFNGRVANTCNLSEDYIGYSTRWGDSVGDFAPLANLIVAEVKAVGYECGLPKHLVDKTPADGLCGKTDEDNIGFSYEILDKYIRTGICENEKIKEKIDMLHKKNLFKLQPIASFKIK